MFRARITHENEKKLRSLYLRDGYMSKITNIALKEFFDTNPKEKILKKINS
jgi:hypothetical protein